MENWIEKIGIAASITLPFFNIPLIVRLWKRKRSDDFSLSWALGVWVCIVLMTPQALRSTDTAFRVYGYVNIFFFSIVVFMIVWYRRRS
jgi:uncharacterized protein with PQ loop repeat